MSAPPLTLNFYVNDKPKTVTVADGAEPLLYVLRNQLGMQGVKFGCGLLQCGACTVILNGATTRSCRTPLNTVGEGAHVTTIEGLGHGDDLSPIQKAFLDNQAGQCAYCASGIIMGAYNWLQQRRAAGNTAIPTDSEVTDFLSGINQSPAYVYLCRCGSHMRIIRAIQQASREFDHD